MLLQLFSDWLPFLLHLQSSMVEAERSNKGKMIWTDTRITI